MISVVINTYNRKDDLLRAINSVKKQSIKNLQIIVVDDASTDGTKELFVDDIGIKYIRNPTNQGLAKSREIGLTHCDSDIVAFLDDDDYFFDEKKLELQLEILKSNEDIAVVCTDIIEFDSLNNDKAKTIKWPKDIVKHFLFTNGIIYPSTTLVRKKLIEKVGGYDFRFPRGIDSDVYRRLIFSGYKICHLPILSTCYKVESSDKITDSISITGLKKDLASNLLTVRKYWSLYFKYPFVFAKKIFVILKKYIKILIVMRSKNGC